MLEQTLPEAIRVQLRALQRIDVVVHLDIAGAVLVYQPCDYLVQVRPHFRVPKVEQEPRILQHSLAMAHEKPVVGFFREEGLGRTSSIPQLKLPFGRSLRTESSRMAWMAGGWTRPSLNSTSSKTSRHSSVAEPPSAM